MLFPSLYNLHLDGLLASELTIIGSGRSKMDRAAFQVQVQGALAEHLPADRIDEAGVESFLERIDYCAIDAGSGTGYDELAALLGDRLGRPIGVYLSTPPSMFGPIAQGRSEEHTSELQSLMRISYAVFCLKKKNKQQHI